VSLKIRGLTEKYLLRQAARPVITETVYRRQKHPFLSPPVTTVPAERFHEMMQDTLRGPILASLPFYDQKKVVALLDRLPAMSRSDHVGWDPVLMSVLSACVIQERFGLDSKVAEDETFEISDSFPLQDNSMKRNHASGQLQPL
jgi:asparagine synthase (glutamine-hydrolysing)